MNCVLTELYKEMLDHAVHKKQFTMYELCCYLFNYIFIYLFSKLLQILTTLNVSFIILDCIN